jgi:hypothetical protein
MSFDIKSIQRNTRIQAPRIFLYGVEGIGKTTFAAGAPDPIFICTEDGLGSLQVDHFPLASKASEVLDAIATLCKEDHKFKTVVLDSVDWLDNMIWADVEATHDAKDLAYGKGAMIVADRWREMISGFNYLRNTKNMVVILLGHSQIKRFDSPEVEPYDRYQPKLQERSNAILREWVDALLFANYKTIVRKDDVGFNKTNNRGVSTGERLIYTSEKPAYMAKNRYSLPESLPMSWEAFSQAIA